MKSKFVLLALLMLTSCGVFTRTNVNNESEQDDSFRFSLTFNNTPQQKYIDNDYSIALVLEDNRANRTIVQRHDNYPIMIPNSTSYPEVSQFVNESIRYYMRNIGFNVDADVLTDYMLNVSIKEFACNFHSNAGWVASVKLSVKVYRDNVIVYPATDAVGRFTVYGADDLSANNALNRAFENAVKDIDWDKIAYFLKKADKPSMEKNKQVQGLGDTSLESQVIRWYIDSSPKGADISFRIVSSTPEVKNTNQNYVGSTPYESTESFDVIGLTYNNSGNVQIEVSCEKPGYITQKKRFNLRQVIDQKEISTKFNLIKEE